MVDLTLTDEELKFYKKYKLKVPTRPTMIDPFELEKKLRESGKATLNKKGDMLDKRTEAFDEVLDIVTQGRAQGVPKQLPNGDIDTGKELINPRGNSRYINRKKVEHILASDEPLIQKPDGTLSFQDFESKDLETLVDPLAADSTFEGSMKRIRVNPGKAINVKGIDEQEFTDTFFPERSEVETITPTKTAIGSTKDIKIAPQGELPTNEAVEELESKKPSTFDELIAASTPDMDTVIDWIIPDKNPNRIVDEDGLTENNKAFREDNAQIGAGVLAAPGEVVYGTTGFALKGAELAADYVNRKIVGDEVKPIKLGSDYYFDKTARVTKTGEHLTGAEPVTDIHENFFRNLGGALWSLPVAGPLAALTDTIVGTSVGDIIYDMTDPKYKSLPDLLERKPTNKVPELKPYAEVGMIDGDEAVSSFYEKFMTWPWLIIGAAGTVGGYKTIQKMYKHQPPASVLIDPELQPTQTGKPPGDWTSEKPLESITKPGTAVRTSTQDSNAIIKWHAREAYGKGKTQDANLTKYLDELNTQTHVAGQETAASSVRTGRIITPTRILDGPSPYVLREAHRKLKPQQQELFNQGMIAADKLDDIANGKSVQVVGMTRKDAEAIVARMRQDPILADMEQAYRKVTSNILDFSMDTALIDPLFRSKLQSARPGFMPNFPVENADRNIFQKFGDILFKDPGGSDDNLSLLPTLHRRDEDVSGREFLPPMDALVAYVQHSVQFANHNRLRKKLLTDMMFTNNERVKRSVRQLLPGQKSIFPTEANRVTGYYVNGEKLRFEVADPMLAKALEFAPNAAMFPLMNGFRKYSQMFLTGHNPFFAPIAFMREAHQASLFRPKGTKFGPMDSIAQAMTGGRMGIRGDMTGFMNVLGSASGVPRDLIPKAALALSEHIHSTLMAGNKPFWGQLDAMFGEGSTRAVADRLRNAYITSMRGTLDSMGGYNVKHTQYGITEASSRLDQASKAWEDRFGEGSSTVWNAYKASIESLHNATRLYFYSQNYKKGMSVDEMRHLASQTQNLTGDLRVAGLGPSASKLKKAESTNEGIRRGLANAVNGSRYVVRGSIETSLYANPMLQGMARVASTIKNDPSGFAMGLFNTMAVPTVGTLTMAAYLNSTGEYDYLDHYFNRRTEWEKVNSIPIYLPGVPPELAPKIEIDPTVGIFNYALASIIDQIVSNREFMPQVMQPTLEAIAPSQMVRRSAGDEFTRSVWSAIGSTVGMNLPVPISAWLALNDYDTFNTAGPGYGGIYKKKTEQLSGGGELTGLQEPDNVLPMWGKALIEEVHGAVGGFITSMMDAGAAGYDEDGITTAVEAMRVQAKVELARNTRFLKPLHGYNVEYPSYESDIKYEKQRAADNLADVISAQINKEGKSIRTRAPKGVEGIISDDAMKGLNEYVAQSGRRLNPIKNQVFLQNAELIYDTVAKGETKKVIDALSIVTKQQKDLKAINAGNLYLYDQNIRKEGEDPYKTMTNVQKRINELEKIKRQLNIRYIQQIKVLEEQLGASLEDIDPYKEVQLPQH